MSTQDSLDSKTSIIIKEGKDGFQKWNGDDWERVYLSPASGASEEELENGLPMKVLRFMGLPKSYRHELYSEFVHDVKQIPADTASSFFNVVSWVCGKTDDEGSRDKPNDDKSSTSPVGQGDAIERLQEDTTSITELPDSTNENAKIFKTDPISNEQIVPSVGFLVSDGPPHAEVVCVTDSLEIKVPKQINTHPSIQSFTEEYKKEAPVSHVLEFDNNNNDTRTLSPYQCCSETCLYYGMSESENESECINRSRPATVATPLQISDEENEEEEVKRVTFAPSSETNIYAYQDYDTEAEETDDAPLIEEGQMSNSEMVKVTGEIDPIIENPSMQKVEVEFINADVENDDDMEINSPVSSPTLSESDMVDEDHEIKETIENAPQIRMCTSSSEIEKSFVKEEQSTDPSATTTSPPTSTSEVQVQLNKDLKTLEDTVKSIYKSLNKKGPLTIVANFKPKENGELVLDKESLMGTPTVKSTLVSSDRLNKSLPTAEMEKEEKKQSVTRKRPDLEKMKGTENVAEKKSIPAKQKQRMVKQAVQYQPKSSTTTVSQHSPAISPVGIMKNSNDARTHGSHQRSCPLQNRKSLMSVVSKTHFVSGKSLKMTTFDTESDNNNNVPNDRGNPQQTSLKPAIKLRNKMPSLRPASSSHLMTNNLKSPDADAPKVKSSRSKHLTVKAPCSQHILFKNQADLSQQHFKILEASNSQRYLVPVNATPAKVIVSDPPRSASHHILLEPHQPQHLYTEAPYARQIYMEAAPQVLKENSHPQVIVEGPQHHQHILVESPPPPTCHQPHLHPRTAKILPPSATSCQKPATSSLPRGNFRLIKSCRMHSQHFLHQQQSQICEECDQDEASVLEESTSNASIASNNSSVSSTFSGADCYLRDPSDEKCDTVVEEVIPIANPQLSPTGHQHQQTNHRHQNRSLSGKSSAITHLQARKKHSTEKILTGSSSATKQYRATIHIPTGPPKPSSYTAIFKEKQQQKEQKQSGTPTFYVDLTSKAIRKNR